ncbi:carbohydrate ABC transporter permease [Streptosporangium roseum]|uniref:ABC transporter membrane spanning protein (Galacturonic acid) n=1 Tax=Streptosporangium roseum (strain ATCC 12428 / DSM 43021 / JCM 3005 / KCTC 9067 / NCIMB 10171 / NRRL 2505 / NI 9100) TaxID=479432 RepID=D2AQS6_STRRD|nr:sugar ABC transporter permease [Streptosporangium roseum]ACZ86473.1 ABC transporter membrane spanning protein (galacturonic acid) [Streptosporangium roseum DSM 43021]
MASPVPAARPTATPEPGRRRRRLGLGRRDHVIGWLLITPAMAYFVVFLLYPALSAFYYSLTDWNLRSAANWVGPANYADLLFDDVKYPHFWKSVQVTLQYTLIAVPLTLGSALAQALLINAIRRGSNLFRLLLFLPVVTAEAAVGAIWRWLYDPRYGLVNGFLGLFGVPGQNWLNTPDLVIPALAFIAAWQCGISMIIYLAGLKGIPDSIREAATIDGAGPVQRFRKVVFPMLRPTTFYLLVTGVIAALQVFGLVYVIFSGGGGKSVTGGPEQSGLTYVLHLYLFAFRYDAMGAACAMSFILFLFIMIITALQFKFVKQEAS